MPVEAGAMTTTQLPDLRPDLAAAQQWVATLLRGVAPEQLAAPTPCSEYDVLRLAAHLCAGTDKVAGVAAGLDPRQLPSTTEVDAARLADDFATRATRAQEAWRDDALLARTLTAPFGEAPGALALGAFLMETVAHGWDLAAATGQPAEVDPAVAAAAYAVGQQALGEGFRAPGGPFGPVVEPRPEAGPTERLAAFLGRDPARWVR